MNITGIIAEYNPFHNGHLYHLQTAKEKTDADFIVIVMSGNFVQRGTPALLSKYKRAEMALKCGADLVLELPSIFASSSAEFFSEGSIALLDALGCVTSLCFGTETEDIAKISFLAKTLQKDNPSWQTTIKQYLSQGDTYPKARSKALLDSLEPKERLSYETILKEPNNILAIEYHKALYRRNSSIQVTPILRKGNGYHNTEISKNDFSSATSIRKFLKNINCAYFSRLQTQLPDPVLPILFPEYKRSFEKVYPIWEDDFTPYLQYALWSNQKLTHFLDMNEELEHRLLRVSDPSSSYSQYVTELKNKSYTQTRIQRALLHIILGMTTEQRNNWKSWDYTGYCRILGFKKSATPLLKHIKSHCNIPIIQKVASAKKILPDHLYEEFQKELKIHQLYEMVYANKYRLPYKNEATLPPLIL